MLSTEDTAVAFVRTRKRLADGNHFSPSYVAAVGQMHRAEPGQWPVHQVAAFLDIHAAVGAGRYALVEVEVAAAPRPDADRDVNAAALKDLPDPFSAELDLDQNAADEDGTISWKDAITAVRSTSVAFSAGCQKSEPVTAPVLVRPSRIPLEVGTTMPSRTLMHLEQDGGVARWAYGSTDLYLLLNLRHPLLA
ncbi:hypothetical protein [Streptomyces sp. NPDC049915]|uniref:hypothetical protein n=1 Tax=Streptomyces sp. NPDC049915 TaxID=3155510 RepID=UPI00342F0533